MKIIRPSLSLLLLALLALPGASRAAWGGAPDPVAWTARVQPADARAGEGAQVVLSATISGAWHMYSLTQPAGGPNPTKIALAPGKALVAAGKAVQPPPKREHDPNFNIEVELYSGGVAFGIPVKIAPGPAGARKAAVTVRYQVCNDRTCLPPKTLDVPVAFTVAAGPARPNRARPPATVPAQPATAQKADGGTPAAGTAGSPAGTPPAGAAAPDGAIETRIQRAQASGLGAFLWLALSMGFLALLTPCVFPMVPITVSFFSKQHEADQRAGMGGAVAYCLGIIATFTGLGLLLTVLFGASGISRFATNPWVNVGLAALFVVLAINLFGAFEIVLPSSLVNRAQAGTRRGRFVGPLLMGLTFTLTSFTCTVPFVGTLLVATTQGSALWPFMGMLAFSTAFASPFFLLALFPQWLARLPKSGPWLTSVKATMGFLELAAALKFLSNADLVWQTGLLTRPVFLSIWSTIGVVAGLYLLGWLRLPHDSGAARTGPFRRTLGIVTAAAGLYCLAAIGGRTLGEMDAYLPPRSYGFPSGTMHVAGATQWLDDYDQAVARAKAEGKPLFINFTGFTCTNCRLMEDKILPLPEVTAALARFIPVELYTDGKDEKYRRNQALEERMFGTVALPLYAVVTPEGKRLREFAGMTRNPREFVAFLDQAHSQATQMARRS
jgi:thiol:disulfide interchange protein